MSKFKLPRCNVELGRGERSNWLCAVLRPLRSGHLCGLALALLVAIGIGFSGASYAHASPPSNAIRFLHNADGRLKAVIDPESSTAVYNWDAAGNLNSIIRHSSEELSIVELTPSTGEIGEMVEIQGTGFSAEAKSDTVKFNGTTATVSAATPWSLTVEVPAEATSGTVTVSTPGEGPVASSQSFTVGSTSKPSISSISPTIAAAGEEVTISGSNFDSSFSANVVTANQSRPEVTSASSSSIAFKVPGATLGGHVSVATANGSDTGPDLYIPPEEISPSKVGATGRFSLGEPTTTELTEPETVALKLFDGVGGQRVAFTLSESSFSGTVSIWDPQGSYVSASEASFSKSGGGIIEPVTLPSSGTYTVLIRGSGEQTGSVKLSAFTVEDITGTITPSKEGEEVSDTIATPGQNARYSVAVTAGEVVSLNASSAFEEWGRLEWRKPGGEMLEWNWLRPSGSFSKTRFPTTGTYTLTVNPEGSDTGAFALTAFDASDLTDSIEPTEGGETATFPIEVPGQRNVVSFSGTKGQHVTLVESKPSFGGVLEVRSPEGNYVSEGYASWSKESSPRTVGPMILPETGSYSVAIEGNGEQTGSVELTAYTAEDITGSITPTKEGAEVSDSITTPGQVAQYSVSVEAGQVVSLKASSAFEEWGRLEWRKPGGEMLEWNWLRPSGSFSKTRFPTTGTYTLTVNPEGSDTGAFALTAFDASDLTDSIEPTEEGEAKSFSIEVPGQRNLVSFSGTKGEQVTLVESEPSFGGVLEVRSPEGNYVSEGYASWSKESSPRTIGPMVLPETGTYSVAIEGNNEQVGSLELTAYTFEDLTGSITPSKEGTEQKGTITTPGQVARYSVSVEAGDVISLNASSAFEEWGRLEWRKPGGAMLEWNWLRPSGSFVKTRFPTEGTYTLTVNPEGSDTGAFSLTAFDASDLAGSIEPTEEGESKSFPIEVPGQRNVVSFSGSKGDQVSLVISEPSFGGYLEVHSPEGNYVSEGYASWSKESSPRTVGPLTLPETGTYSISIEGNGAETGNVHLKAFLSANISGSITPTKEGAEVADTITIPGQVANYSVAVTAGEVVSLNASSAFEEWGRLEWRKPGGEMLEWNWLRPSGSFVKTRFPTTGTYTLTVNPEGSDTGAFSLTAFDASDLAGSIEPTEEGETKSFPIEVPGQRNVVSFSGTKGQHVTLVESEPSFGGSLEVHSPEGGYVSEGYASWSKESSPRTIGPMTLPETGTYSVGIEGNNEQVGSLELTAYTFEDITGSITPTKEGAEVSDTITTSGQVARYSVSVEAGDVVSVKASSAFEEWSRLEWRKPGGEMLESSWLRPSGSFVKTRFPTTGTYTLTVNPEGSDTGAFSLTAFDASDLAGSIEPTEEGETKSFPIEVPGQRNVVSFSGTKGERVTFVASEPGFAGVLEVRSPEGAYVSEGYVGWSKESSPVIAGPITLPEAGTYSVAIEGSGEQTGSVKLTAYTAEDITGSITPSKEGTEQNDTITTPGQVARYSVAAEAGDVVSVKASSAFEEWARLEWRKPGGEMLESSWLRPSGSFIKQRFPTEGTYTLTVNPVGADTGAFSLTAFDASDLTSSIEPTEEGETKSIPIEVPGQRHVVTFAGTKGQHVTLVASEPSFGGSLEVHSPEGAYVSEGYVGWSKESSPVIAGPITLPEAGTYSVAIEGSGEQTGSVKLTAYTAEDVTGSIIPSKEGTEQNGTITTPGQMAHYSVAVEAGDVVSVKASSAFEEWARLEWRKPGGEMLESSWLRPSGSFAKQRFPTTGTYTLTVNPVGADTGAFSLTAFDASDLTSSIEPTEEGETKSIPIEVPGQRHVVTFAGTEGDQVTLVASEPSFAGTLEVHSPEGAYVSGGYAGWSKESSPSSVGPLTLAETGTYKIWIEGNGEQTGSVELTASSESGVAWRSSAQGTTELVSFTVPNSSGLGGDSPASKPAGSARVGVGHPGAAVTPRSSSDERAGDRRKPIPSAKRVRRHRRMHGRKKTSAITPAMRAFHPAAVKAWHPQKNVPGWEAAEPTSPWMKLAPLQAPAGVTALSGQVLGRNGLPLAGAEVSVEGSSVHAKTDDTGRFLLSGIPAGHQRLVVDGESVRGRQRYGSYEVGVELADHETTALDYTTWLTALDPTGDRRLDSPTKGETSLKTPSVPGLEVRIPAGTVIRDAAGRTVRNLNVSAIPVNQAPFPLPPFVPIPVYFTIQPGRAYLSKGAQVVYPNWGHLEPGSRAEFWNYDANDRGWYVYGRGTVTADGKQVVPDPGVRVWQFTGAMLAASPLPPGDEPTGPSGGDPVDLYSGLFTYHKTDLVLPDTIPIVIQRSYRQGDSNSYSFGTGTANLYDMRLWSGHAFSEADLIMPDGQRIHYVRTSEGTGYGDAKFESRSTPGKFYASTMTYDPSGGGAYWDMKLTNGTTYVFGVGRLMAIRDAHGDKLTITRSGENITQITSPHGRWVKFTYDGSNRITEITDNGGQHLKYAYTSGLLTSATDPAGRKTEYEYNGSGEMTSVTDPRGNKYLETAYEGSGRVEKQTMGGSRFEFSYELNEAGEAEAATVTDPRGSQREVHFDSQGLAVSEVLEPGTEYEESTTFERQPETGLLLSMTDSLGRKTALEYDGSGNVTEVTRLAGTEAAQTTKFSFEPGTDYLTAETDPLGHTTEYKYGPKGEMLKQTDPLGHETSLEYDGDGQVTAITNPSSETTHFSYTGGDLSSVTDPLGRTSTRFIDGLGRVRASTSPGGERTLYSYNEDNQLTSETFPSGAKTSIEYDSDGDPILVTDPRGNETTRSYDVMDRLESETDPLGNTAEWTYDEAGDLEEVTDREGNTTTFSFDPLRRLTSATYAPSGKSPESSIVYEYDEANRPIKVQDSASGEYNIGYDELDRTEYVEGPTGTVGYTYDAAGRREAMLASGQEPTEYSFDKANRLTGITRGGESVGLEYDESDRPETITLPDGIQEQYGYDAAGEPTSIAYEGAEGTLGAIDYAYDANGQLEATWGSYARTGLPEPLSSTEYNADNELIEREGQALEYDKDGNLISDGANEYGWDVRGQLSEISGATSASFGYDPFGRRISKTLEGTTTEMLYDNANVVQESVEGSASANLLTGLAPDQIFSRSTEAGTDSYLTDRLGSVIALASGSGEVETDYTYELFGVQSNSGASSDNPFGFTGRENDGTGLQYNRARYYSPAMGRFISQDPIGFAGSGTNFYWYAGGEPLGFTDPSGKIPNPFEPLEHFAEERGREIGESVTEAEQLASEVISDWEATEESMRDHYGIHPHPQSCAGLMADINLNGCPEEGGGEFEEGEGGRTPVVPIDPQHPVPVEPSIPRIPIRPPLEIPIPAPAP